MRQDHGHTGYGWAARREVLSNGLYDGCISGLGDHLMAHAFAGEWNSGCLQLHFRDNLAYRSHFEKWYRAVYRMKLAGIGCVPGKVLHLWHGEYNDRRYIERNLEMNNFGFDPSRDLRVGSSGCHEWNSAKPDLHCWAKEYFQSRREDGCAPT